MPTLGLKNLSIAEAYIECEDRSEKILLKADSSNAGSTGCRHYRKLGQSELFFIRACKRLEDDGSGKRFRKTRPPTSKQKRHPGWQILGEFGFEGVSREAVSDDIADDLFIRFRGAAAGPPPAWKTRLGLRTLDFFWPTQGSSGAVRQRTSSGGELFSHRKHGTW